MFSKDRLKNRKRKSVHDEGGAFTRKIADLRRRVQKREAEFVAAHPSKKLKIGAAFASRRNVSTGMPQHEPGKKKGFFFRITSQWWDRLLSSASEGNFAEQAEQYAAHQTKRDYVLNTIGHTAWGMAFPLLTIIVTQFADVELAGMFSFAFMVGTLLMIAASYGVRTYQVSDLDEEHSFADYQINRLITCLLVLLVGYLFCKMRGYDSAMMQILTGVFTYRILDALADVYEGRLQQKDKMYLAGVSQLVRSVISVIVFTLFLLIGRNVGVASIAMAATGFITFLFLTFPLALLETPKSQRPSVFSIATLFKQCMPIFVALLLYALIDAVPKFVMELSLPYDNQLYFNALYFPSQAILLTIGLIYKPCLVRMAATWADRSLRRRFDIFIVVMLLVIFGMTVLAAIFMKYLGVQILGIMYGLDFERFRGLAYVMIAAGGLTGAIDFLYQVITIMRRQELVTRSYLITFAASIVSALILVNVAKLPGAVASYTIVMFALFVIMGWVYVSERINIARHPERDLAVLALPAPGQTTVIDQSMNAALSGYGNLDDSELEDVCQESPALAPEPPLSDGRTVEAQVEVIRPSVKKRRIEE